jgi:hypothetical protein
MRSNTKAPTNMITPEKNTSNITGRNDAGRIDGFIQYPSLYLYSPDNRQMFLNGFPSKGIQHPADYNGGRA